MSKTQILWILIYFGGLMTAYIRGPIYGLLVYMYTFYTQFSWAGSFKSYRWSLLASLAFAGAYIFKKSSAKQLSHFRMPQLKWLILFILNMAFVSAFAVDPDANKDTIFDFCKLTVLYYLIIGTVLEKIHYRMFLWLQLWGNYLFSWQGYHEGTSHGRLEGIGGASTNTSNGLANHLIMILPFLNNFFFYGNKYEKAAAIWCAPWILNALILCNSRGAFLGMIAIAMIALFRADRQNRKKIIIGMILGGLLFIYLADDRFWKRMDTISDENTQSSSRIETWIGALEMIKDHPLGAGGDGWLHYSPVYIPEIIAHYNGMLRSVHNSYLQVATNYGIQGFLIYLLFISHTLLELHKIRKRIGAENDHFYHTESSAIEMAIWGFLVAATFGARPYFEAFIWFSALGSALSNIQQSEIQDRKGIASSKHTQRSIIARGIPNDV